MGKLERYIIVGIYTAVIIFLIWFFSNVVSYILVAAVVSLMGKPLVDTMSRFNYKSKYVPKWCSATITICLMWTVSIILISILLPLIYSKVQTFSVSGITNFVQNADKPLNELKDYLMASLGYELQLSSSDVMDEVYTRLNDIIISSVNSVGFILDFISSAFVALFSITFIAFFFMKEDKLFGNGITILFPEKYKNSVQDALSTSINLISKYFIGLTLESTIKIIVITVGLKIIGFDFGTSLLIGIITGVLNVIPYIGPLIGAAVGLLIAVSAHTDSASLGSVMLAATLLLLVFQLFDNIILQPYIYSNSVKAHPLEVFLVILIAGSMAGVWGMLLAIPAYTVLRVFAKIFLSRLMVVQKLTDKI